MLRRVSVCATVLLLCACEGPTGPEGPAGPEGDPGPGTRLSYEGRVDSDGSAFVDLPTEAGSTADLPVVVCYVSDAAAGPYLVVATDTYSGITCGVGTDAGRLYVGVVGAPAFWYYRISVVY